jgi:hypothetical protein
MPPQHFAQMAAFWPSQRLVIDSVRIATLQTRLLWTRVDFTVSPNHAAAAKFAMMQVLRTRRDSSKKSVVTG